MASRIWLAALAAVLLSSRWLSAQETQPTAESSAADEQRIAGLIKELDADKAEAREAATAELRKIGQPALATLEKTLANPPSIESKFRLQSAIDGIKLDLARQQALKIDDILAQARAAQKEGWELKTLEAQLDALVRILQEETGKKDFKLPVKLSDLNQPPIGVISRGALVKDQRVKVSIVDNSIVLCDSIADVGIVRNSIVIAPVAVCMLGCENSLVIAGRLVASSSSTRGSVVLCNSRLELSSVHDSILAGQDAVNLSISQGTTLVNSPAPQRIVALPGRDDNTSVEVKGIIFGEKSASSGLDGKLAITHTMPTIRDRGLVLFKLPDGTGEYVARVDQEIKTPQGDPIESLQGWKLIHAGSRLAVFAKGDEIACVKQER